MSFFNLKRVRISPWSSHVTPFSTRYNT